MEVRSTMSGSPAGRPGGDCLRRGSRSQVIGAKDEGYERRFLFTSTCGTPPLTSAPRSARSPTCQWSAGESVALSRHPRAKSVLVRRLIGATPGIVVPREGVTPSRRPPPSIPHDPGSHGRGRVCPWATRGQHARPATSGTAGCSGRDASWGGIGRMPLPRATRRTVHPGRCGERKGSAGQ
jgi:hypothetical protein